MGEVLSMLLIIRFNIVRSTVVNMLCHQEGLLSRLRFYPWAVEVKIFVVLWKTEQEMIMAGVSGGHRQGVDAVEASDPSRKTLATRHCLTQAVHTELPSRVLC